MATCVTYFCRMGRISDQVFLSETQKTGGKVERERSEWIEAERLVFPLQINFLLNIGNLGSCSLILFVYKNRQLRPKVLILPCNTCRMNIGNLGRRLANLLTEDWCSQMVFEGG